MSYSNNDGIFYHQCEHEGCTRTVPYDDEPKCFEHSPDEGSSVRGYSARTKALTEAETENPHDVWAALRVHMNSKEHMDRKHAEERAEWNKIFKKLMNREDPNA